MKWTLIILLTMRAAFTFAQCEVVSEVLKDGLAFKHTNKELLYSTKTYTLFSAAFHDGERYYLKMVIRPMKSKRVKKEQIMLELKNGEKHRLDFYDAFEVKKDTALDLLFEIKEEVLNQLVLYDVKSIALPMDSTMKHYNLIEHHALIRSQLNCLSKELGEKK
jgi:hypothetical protein